MEAFSNSLNLGLTIASSLARMVERRFLLDSITAAEQIHVFTLSDIPTSEPQTCAATIMWYVCFDVYDSWWIIKEFAIRGVSIVLVLASHVATIDILMEISQEDHRWRPLCLLLLRI